MHRVGRRHAHGCYYTTDCPAAKLAPRAVVFSHQHGRKQHLKWQCRKLAFQSPTKVSLPQPKSTAPASQRKIAQRYHAQRLECVHILVLYCRTGAGDVNIRSSQHLHPMTHLTQPVFGSSTSNIDYIRCFRSRWIGPLTLADSQLRPACGWSCCQTINSDGRR